MTLTTPAGPLVLADSIRSLSALAYLRFQQAELRLSGLPVEHHAIQAHLARHAAFLTGGDLEAARTSFDNLIEAVNAVDAGESLWADALAPAVVSIGGRACADLTPDGLALTAAAVLATGIGQVEMEAAVAELKKNFTPS